MTKGLWLTYVWCGWLFVVGVIDQAWGGWSAAMLLGAFGLVVGFLAHFFHLLFRWRKLGWRGLIPLAVCVATLPAVWVVGALALRARFHWNKDRYEAMAQAAHSSGHPALLGDEARVFAHRIELTRFAALNEANREPCVAAPEVTAANASQVVAVHFLVVTHGYAGHIGFLRAFDPAAERCLERGQGIDGWWSSRSLGDHWYLVAD